MADFLKPGEKTKIIFHENEFDVLERNLVGLTSDRDIYQAVSCVIIKKMQPSFILFSTTMPAASEQSRYFLLRKGKDTDALDYYNERRKSGAGVNDIYAHQTGGFSVAYQPTPEIKGCMYIGPACDGTPYTDEQLKELRPVIRILNKSLLACESYRVKVERKRLQDAFSHYVSPDIVQDIIHNPDTLHLGGEKRFLSCIFTDLQGFTSLSDSMDPIMLVRVLNMYLNEMSQVIISLGGVIDKFEGDAIMAFFGAPHELKDHAVRCCLSALRMKRMEQVLNEQLQHEHLIQQPLFTRIGINSGDMVVGNIGSLQRLDYTIVGSNVNIASRLENANKNFNTSILISGATYELVKEYFDCRSLGSVMLRGVSRPVKTYELLAQRNKADLSFTNFIAAADDPAAKDGISMEELGTVEEL